MAKKVLVVDDEKLIVKGIRFSLEQDGMEVDCAYDGEEALQKANAAAYDMILLDLMLPGEDGIAILKKLKSQTAYAGIPIIIASAKGTEYDKITGLDLGADDYLAKPFGMMEMLSRVKAVLRRTMPKNTVQPLSIGFLELNPSEHTVSIWEKDHKIPVELTRKEYELLHLLMSHPGMVFTRDALLADIWEFEYTGGTRTVDVHVGTLRTKLGSCGNYIKTVRF